MGGAAGCSAGIERRGAFGVDGAVTGDATQPSCRRDRRRSVALSIRVHQRRPDDPTNDAGEHRHEDLLGQTRAARPALDDRDDPDRHGKGIGELGSSVEAIIAQ